VLFGVLNYIDFFSSPFSFFKTYFADPMRPTAQLRFIYPDDINRASNYGHEIGHWLSAVMLLILVLFIKSSRIRSRIGWSILMLVSATCLVFSMTKSAWVGFGVGLFYITYREYFSKVLVNRGNIFKLRTRPIRASLLLIGAPIVIGLFFWLVVLPANTRNLIILAFTFQDVSSTERLDFWQNLFPIIRENLVFGVGWGNLIARSISRDPHNWWLGMLAEAGLVGFILYGIAYGAIFYLVDRRSRRLPNEMQLLAVGANATLLSLGFAGLFEMSFMWSMDTWFVIGMGIFFAQAKLSGEVETV
jgi:O-antigen ligase